MSVLRSGAAGRLSFRRMLVLGIAMTGTLGALLGYAERDGLVAVLTDWWIVTDPLVPSDAVVVLGGGLNARPAAAAELYHQGLVRKVLISRVSDDQVGSGSQAVEPGHTELNRKILLKLKVPADAIDGFGTDNASTHDEAVALAGYARANGMSSFILPIEFFSSRRVDYIFRRELPEVRIRVKAVEPPQYTRTDWSSSRNGLVAFRNELFKYLYYRVRYCC
jgi:hypothetical protein